MNKTPDTRKIKSRWSFLKPMSETLPHKVEVYSQALTLAAPLYPNMKTP